VGEGHLGGDIVRGMGGLWRVVSDLKKLWWSEDLTSLQNGRVGMSERGWSAH
jgi:hypothetical protein